LHSSADSFLILIKYTYRFPFTASEIFNCEINQLLDRFFDAPEEQKKEAPASDEEEDEEKQTVKQ
jgi:hypothetical protein